ncbi:flagellar basal body P-ring formation protein FlgA [Vibrio sp. S9_S30]|uniref:flagellar basal body P-ring formation chaperone FlgA n=1 Tax=Vibrio sp. S9_S30 TaxID=2720226 RepID=UPI00168115E9|nr:flagellar basal body P-ring formation chaperone FlgA [Vibrio sp. S9_S30]MBD1559545.1 flagellar basal body P-ring formation protein FlgA [Vibrio sp. S9_S30]
MQSISKCRAICKKFGKSIGFCLTFFSLYCSAATEQQIKDIQNAAKAHVKATFKTASSDKLELNAANLDSRIKTSSCPSPLVTSSPSNSHSNTNVTVLVECIEDNWRVYVPVRITLMRPLVTALRPLARGELINKSDISITFVEQRAYRRYGFNQMDQVTGAKLKKNIRQGEVIERRDICVVCRNEGVIIKAVKGELTITTKGTALSDGAQGEQVKVKNTKSNRIIDAIVTGIAEVTVTF